MESILTPSRISQSSSLYSNSLNSFPYSNSSNSSIYSLGNINETDILENNNESYHAPRTLDSYNIIRTLGRGGFGEVSLAQIKDSNQLIALKSVYVKDPEVLKLVNHELKALEAISKPTCHPFLACYYDHHYDAFNNRMYIEMEYIDGVELSLWANRFRNQGNIRSLYYNLTLLMIDLCRALEFIHSKNIIHKDIKPENILITVNNVPKLIDFGTSCSAQICPIQNSNIAVTCCFDDSGTPVYQPPETILYKENFFSSDIWSFGATIFKAATDTLCFPVSDPNNVPQVRQIIASTEPYKLNTSNLVLNQAVNSCLVRDPLGRITVASLLQFLLNNR